MDKIDAALLKLLQENARMTVSELSKTLSLSRPSVSERIIRLQEKGIIEEFSARVAAESVGRDITLFIQVNSLKVSPVTFEDMMRTDEDVIECHRVTGQIDYVLKASVYGMEGMKLLIDRLMPFGVISTSVVLSSPVKNRHILPRCVE